MNSCTSNLSRWLLLGQRLSSSSPPVTSPHYVACLFIPSPLNMCLNLQIDSSRLLLLLPAGMPHSCPTPPADSVTAGCTRAVSQCALQPKPSGKPTAADVTSTVSCCCPSLQYVVSQTAGSRVCPPSQPSLPARQASQQSLEEKRLLLTPPVSRQLLLLFTEEVGAVSNCEQQSGQASGARVRRF